ncbi:MAG: hypothetical protein IPP72_16450 [Chitinophagaceae bacterium]|nr:hypothetical protein [Chitinophagaceae bacterium]
MYQLTCANCGNNYTGHFCNQCGQKQAHRYTVGHVLREIMHGFTHADKGIFSFAWQVLTRPGTIALDMVQGGASGILTCFNTCTYCGHQHFGNDQNPPDGANRANDEQYNRHQSNGANGPYAAANGAGTAKIF